MRRRLMLADELPLQLSDSYHPMSVARGSVIELPARVKGGVHAELEDRLGLSVARSVEDLELRMPLPAEVEILELPPGVPVARVLRTAYDAEGQAFEVLIAIVPGDRHVSRYEIDLRCRLRASQGRATGTCWRSPALPGSC